MEEMEAFANLKELYIVKCLVGHNYKLYPEITYIILDCTFSHHRLVEVDTCGAFMDRK